LGCMGFRAGAEAGARVETMIVVRALNTTYHLLLTTYTTDDAPGRERRSHPEQTDAHQESRSNRPLAREAARCGPGELGKLVSKQSRWGIVRVSKEVSE
jgi:hypothetical protein